MTPSGAYSVSAQPESHRPTSFSSAANMDLYFFFTTRCYGVWFKNGHTCSEPFCVCIYIYVIFVCYICIHVLYYSILSSVESNILQRSVFFEHRKIATKVRVLFVLWKERSHGRSVTQHSTMASIKSVSWACPNIRNPFLFFSKRGFVSLLHK